MLDKKELRKVIALVFIKGYEQFPKSKHKTDLASKIVKDSAFKNSTFNERSLLNYFNHFFWDGKNSANPNEDTQSNLLRYINFQNEEQFVENQPSDESYLINVPFSKKVEENKKEQSDEKIVGENNNVNKYIEIKQSNILSGHNSSIIKKIRGKIRQLNFLGFYNKQEIDDDNH